MVYQFLKCSKATLADAIQEALEKNQRRDDSGLIETNSIAGARVLLVEDNKINQMVAVELLQMFGVESTVANNGQEAIEKIKQEEFDLILMDIQMPVMDGLTATQIIRSLDKPGIDKIPILAMTANALGTDCHKSLDVGMNDHLTKPIDPVKLHQALESWIVKAKTK